MAIKKNKTEKEDKNILIINEPDLTGLEEKENKVEDKKEEIKKSIKEETVKKEVKKAKKKPQTLSDFLF